jgi:O-Antigen ligase
MYWLSANRRFSYGWENPNHAAAVIACLIPLMWALREVADRRSSESGIQCAIIGEVFSFLLLVATCSRGALVGLLAALLCFHCRSRRLTFFGPKKDRLLWWRIAAGGIGVLSSGLGSRFAIIATGDASVANRLSLWIGSLKLVAASPLKGWGSGESGIAFMNWVQSLDHSEVYSGVVNSYLQVLVEYGIPVFAAVCSCLMVPIVAIFKQRNAHEISESEDDLFLSGIGAGLVSFLIASLFTTLWFNRSVTWAPLLLVLCTIPVCRAWSLSRIWEIAWRSASIATAASILLYGASLASAAKDPWRLKRMSTGAVSLVRSPQRGGCQATLLVDQLCLGTYYGKVVRSALAETSGAFLDRVNISPLDVRLETAISDNIIAFGCRVRELQSSDLAISTFVVFPTNPPRRDSWPGLRLIAVPEYDVIGYADQWRQWAADKNYRFVRVAGAGQCAPGVFPELLRIIGKLPLK